MTGRIKGPVACFGTNQIIITKGDTLYRQGDSHDCWFGVRSGIVRTCRYHADGSRQVVGFFFEGDVFGADRDYHSTSAEAVTDAVLTRIPQTDDHEAGNLAQGDLLLRALECADRSLFLFGRRKATARLAALLIHFAKRAGESEKVELPMARDDIADHLGLTVETVSRTFSELARRKVIRICSSHLIVIVDQIGLRRLAGDPYELPSSGANRRTSHNANNQEFELPCN